MKIFGNFYKNGSYWIIEIPVLDLMTQAKKKKDINMMAKEAIELLDENEILKVDVIAKENNLIIESDDLRNLVPLILKRGRLKENLSLKDIATMTNAKSINDYAQYEQGKSIPGIDKFAKYFRIFHQDSIVAI